ncbi:MAG: sulfotransferase [Proteobacteria bacterium]|nr:sulfotransferase [Pseudomonadota bacterium]
MMQQGQISKAMAYFQQAVKSDANFAYAYANLGFIFQSQGDFTAAKKSFKQAITKKTDYALAHRMAINLQRSKVKNLWINQMLSVYQSANLKADDKAQICFALAVAHEKNLKFDLAAEYYEKANKHRYQALNYDFRDDLKKFDAIKEIVGKFSTIKFYPKSHAPTIPIFIVGMPRSGTTLTENIISAHSNVFPGGELELFFKLADKIVSKALVPESSTLQRIRDSYFENLKKIAPHSKFITDKLPHNFMHVWLIALLLPEAKIIDISRSPAAVCWSNYTNYFSGSSHGYSCNLSNLIEYHRLYAELMESWRQKFPHQIFSIKYEALVENLEQNARNLISFIGLNWEDACLKPELNDRLVLTASSQQVRQTVYSGSSEKWKHFEPYLDRKFDIFSQSGK